MQRAEGWFICRIGLVETVRAVGLVGGTAAVSTVRQESSAFAVVEVDEQLAERAASLTLERDLRSVDALHLAAALVLPSTDLVLATWDRRLHEAAGAEGLALLPETLP
jgi:predicted nucleic acid-binding protein